MSNCSAVAEMYSVASRMLREKQHEVRVATENLKVERIKLRESTEYSHLKSKTAKDEQIRVDTYDKQVAIYDLQKEVDELQMKKELVYYTMQMMLSED